MTPPSTKRADRKFDRNSKTASDNVEIFYSIEVKTELFDLANLVSVLKRMSTLEESSREQLSISLCKYHPRRFIHKKRISFIFDWFFQFSERYSEHAIAKRTSLCHGLQWCSQPVLSKTERLVLCDNRCQSSYRSDHATGHCERFIYFTISS